MTTNTTPSSKATVVTFVVRAKDGSILATRTSPTMNYTHAVAVDGKNPGVFSWHTTQELARKAQQALAANPRVKGEGTFTVVPVEAHEGSKAKVIKALSTELAAKRAAAAKAAPAKAAPATKATTAKAAPAKGTKAAKATTAKASDQDGKAPSNTAKEAAAKVAAAKALSYANQTPDATGKVHPGAVWYGLIQASEYSPRQTAERMGVAPMTLNRIFNGKGLPTAKVTVAFAQALGLDAAQVWQGVCDYELAAALAK